MSRRESLSLAVTIATLISCLTCSSSIALENAAGGDIEKSAANPGATGLLVLRVVEGSQAAKVGLKPGDILVSYDSQKTPNMAALAPAMQAASGKGKKEISLELWRAGSAQTLKLKPGRMGVETVPVQKGKKLLPRPPETKIQFDFSRLKNAPIDTWYTFCIQGKKVGFEHNRLTLSDGKLHLESEVAFDGGKQWGINHFLVRVVATAEARPKLLDASFKSPMSKDYSIHAKRETDKASGNRIWKITQQDPSGKKNKDIELKGSLARELFPDYLVTLLCAFMPRERGACFHYTPYNEMGGTVGRPGGLLAVDEETIRVGGKEVKAWRYETRSFGQTGRTHWVDSEGQIVKNQYGGPENERVTKAEALKDLNPKIKPVTAGK